MFEIDDKVLCIKDDWEYWGDCEYPKICHIYTVRSLLEERGLIGIRLREIESPINPRTKMKSAWNIEAFRKIDYDEDSLKSKEKTCNKNKINV